MAQASRSMKTNSFLTKTYHHQHHHLVTSSMSLSSFSRVLFAFIFPNNGSPKNGDMFWVYIFIFTIRFLIWKWKYMLRTFAHFLGASSRIIGSKLVLSYHGLGWHGILAFSNSRKENTTKGEGENCVVLRVEPKHCSRRVGDVVHGVVVWPLCVSVKLQQLHINCIAVRMLGFLPFVHFPGARFSKVPELNGPFSGATIPSVSQERRGVKSSNFTVSLLFVTLKTC